jgi:glycosyltransferase involved in cell wall biosynthesis
MNTTAQELSVIIPVYNGERFIAQAVASARRQSPPVAEIIVVDDGSTDGTAKVVKGLAGVGYLYQVNQGPAAARNHGFRVSQGNLLCFLDADDRLTGSKTEVQFPMLAENPALDIVIGFSQRVVITGWDGVEPVYNEIGGPVFYLHLGSAIIRRSVFERVGLFDEQLALGEDVDWYLRAKESGIRMRFHPEVMQYYLRHDQNVTLQRDLMNQYLVRVFKRSLDRRRSPAAGTAQISWDWSEETRGLSDLGPHPGSRPSE